MGHSRPLFHLISVSLNKQYIFYNKSMQKCSVHPVYIAGIRTHDLLTMSRLPEPLDQWPYILRA